MAMRAFPSCIRNRLRSWFPRLQHHGLSLALFSPCLRIMTALTRVDLASRKVQKSPGSDQLASRERRARTPDLHFLPPEALADNHRISAVVYSASPLLKSWSERSYVRATMPSKKIPSALEKDDDLRHKKFISQHPLHARDQPQGLPSLDYYKRLNNAQSRNHRTRLRLHLSKLFFTKLILERKGQEGFLFDDSGAQFQRTTHDRGSTYFRIRGKRPEQADCRGSFER
ncbi:hypothetical protein BDV97DRAFT_366685 [Delphinella strobiligena]|nr:hypothetical protein BDV97DRAFT_366685 [Delphinella strobiligena]